MSPPRIPPPPPGMGAPNAQPPADPVTAFLAAAVERHGAMQLHPSDIERLGRRIVTIEASSIVPGALSLDVVPDDTFAEAMHYARQYNLAARHPQGAAQAGGFLAELGVRALLLTDTERAEVLRAVRGSLPPRRDDPRTREPVLECLPGGGQGTEGRPTEASGSDGDAAPDAPGGTGGTVVVLDTTRTPTNPRVRPPRGFTPEGL